MNKKCFLSEGHCSYVVSSSMISDCLRWRIMERSAWIVTLLVMFQLDLCAQLKPAVSYPVTPEVASMGKFVDFPVGTYSGVPDISVPLYTIKYKSMQIPLVLSYHAGGIKVDQEASWVGLGWDVFSGGFISESIVGNRQEQHYTDDDFRRLPGYQDFKARFQTAPGYPFSLKEKYLASGWNCAVQNENEGLMIQYMKLYGLGAPDIYSFSFPGGGGKFTLDPDTQEPVILKKDGAIKILKQGATHEAGWKIKTPDGNEYTFDKMGVGYIDAGNGRSTITWKLTKIESVDGCQIFLDYAIPQLTEVVQFGETFVSQVNPYQPEDPHRRSVSTAYTEDSYLTKIVTPLEIVEFVLEPRIDIKGESVKLLKEIVIKDAISKLKIKSFEFSYGYFAGTKDGGNFVPVDGANFDVQCKRLKLLSVREVGYDADGNKVYNPPYVFEYNESVTMPSKSSYARDYWGYYNGRRSNTTLLPYLVPLYLNLSQLKDIPPAFLNNSPKANRAPAASEMEMGILKEIRFPLGGSRRFYYEPHTFDNFPFFDADQVSSGEVVVAGFDNNKPGDPVYINMGMPPGEMPVKFDVGFNGGIQKVPFDVMLGCAVYLKKVQGSTVTTLKTWKLMTDHRAAYNENFRYGFSEYITITPDPNVQYFIQSVLPDALGPQASPSQNASASCTVRYFGIVATGDPKNYGSGLRISKIESRDEQGQLAMVRTYDYNINGTTTGKLLSPPRFLGSKDLTCRTMNVGGECPNLHVSVSTQRFVQYTNNSSSNVSLALSPISGFVGYSAVTVKEVSTKSSAVNSSVRYEFINKENIFAPEFPEDPNLDNGLPLRTTCFNSGNQIVKEEINEYELPEEHSKLMQGYTLEDLYRGPDACVSNCGGSYINPCIYFGRWLFRSYPIKSRWYRLKSRSVKEYSGDQVLTQTLSYSYNALGLVSKETSTASNGDVLTTEFKYPVDYSATPPYPLITSMNTRHFQALIESVKSVNAVVHTKTLNTFVNPVSSVIFPGSTTFKNQASDVIDFIDCKSFSLKGNPREFIGKNGVNTIVLWGRNGSVPVAKIEGATMSQVTAQVPVPVVEALPPSTLRTTLLKLYNIPNVLVSLYLYNDKSQLVEMIDPSKTSTYFQYDAFGRLSLARDHNKNIVDQYQYHYFDPVGQ